MKTEAHICINCTEDGHYMLSGEPRAYAEVLVAKCAVSIHVKIDGYNTPAQQPPIEAAGSCSLRCDHAYHQFYSANTLLHSVSDNASKVPNVAPEAEHDALAHRRKGAVQRNADDAGRSRSGLPESGARSSSRRELARVLYVPNGP